MKDRHEAMINRRTAMIDLRRKGMFDDEIAAELGTTRRAVSTQLYRAKLAGMDVPVSPYNTPRSRGKR